MTTTRLHTVAPDIDQLLRSVATARAYAAGIAAARFALTTVGVREAATDAALVALERGTSLPSLQPQLKQLVERYDQEYFQAQEKSDNQTALASFSRARAISALAFALEANAIEACYESHAATDDLPGLRAVVREALGAKGAV